MQGKIEKKSLLEKLLEYIVGAMLMTLMLITTVDVIGRYFFNLPLHGSTELTEFFLGLMIFSVLPIVCKDNEHISVDLFEEKFSVRFKQYREVVVQLLIFIALLFKGWGIYHYGLRMSEDEITSEILHLPLGYYYYLLVALNVLSLLIVLLVIKKQLNLLLIPTRS